MRGYGYTTWVEAAPDGKGWLVRYEGHGETICRKCLATNREAAVLGTLDKCPNADAPLAGGEKL